MNIFVVDREDGCFFEELIPVGFGERVIEVNKSFFLVPSFGL